MKKESYHYDDFADLMKLKKWKSEEKGPKTRKLEKTSAKGISSRENRKTGEFEDRMAHHQKKLENRKNEKIGFYKSVNF